MRFYVGFCAWSEHRQLNNKISKAVQFKNCFDEWNLDTAFWTIILTQDFVSAETTAS